MFWDSGSKPENLEETHIHASRTCETLHKQLSDLRTESGKLWVGDTNYCTSIPSELYGGAIYVILAWRKIQRTRVLGNVLQRVHWWEVYLVLDWPNLWSCSNSDQLCKISQDGDFQFDLLGSKPHNRCHIMAMLFIHIYSDCLEMTRTQFREK